MFDHSGSILGHPSSSQHKKSTCAPMKGARRKIRKDMIYHIKPPSPPHFSHIVNIFEYCSTELWGISARAGIKTPAVGTGTLEKKQTWAVSEGMGGWVDG